MEIPFELLRTLEAAVAEGTLDRAATTLGVTPSAVSQRIRALESQVGRVVLARSKPVAPTADGTVLLRLARQLALLEHEAGAALGLDESGMARVQLGVNSDSLGTWFLPALAAVAAEQPVVFELHREDQERTALLLQSGTVMGAVTSQREPVAGCISSPLGRIRYEAVASPTFATRWFPNGVTTAALGRAPVVQFDRDDDLQHRYLRARRVHARPPRHIISASSEFARVVELGLGWGMLLASQIDDVASRGGIVRLGGTPVDVPLYWQRWNLASPLLDAVTSAVRDAAAEAPDMISPH